MKDIIFGMPTLVEHSYIEETVKLCKELKLKFIELNMNLPQYQADTIDIANLKALSEKNEIFFTVHLDENLNVCDFNQVISAAYVQTVLNTIEVAKKLKIPVLNMHLSQGVYFTLPDRKVFLFSEYKKKYLENLRAFRDKCYASIGNSPIKICIENTGEYKNFMLEGIKLLLQSDVFNLTWDIGHDHSSGYKDKDFILNNKKRLIHMHIHDAVGRKNHLVLGSGEIDLKEKLDIAKANNCRCVIETKTEEALRKSVIFLEGIN